eukprot:SAG31_NODE_4578_length_3122_cov_1.428713_1_plen_119_part_00
MYLSFCYTLSRAQMDSAPPHRAVVRAPVQDVVHVRNPVPRAELDLQAGGERGRGGGREVAHLRLREVAAVTSWHDPQDRVVVKGDVPLDVARAVVLHVGRQRAHRRLAHRVRVLHAGE